MLIKHNKN